MNAPAPQAIVIGTSAGAVGSLSAILPLLPADFSLPIMVVVHLPPDKKSVMVELFQGKCALKVKEAEDKEPLQPGTVYFAPPDYHLLVEKDFRLSLSNEEAVLFSRPSIDVLFESAADAYHNQLIGIILSGANEDGAKGLKIVADKGGVALVEAPETAYASTMPKEALALSKGAITLSLTEIVDYLQKAAPWK